MKSHWVLGLLCAATIGLIFWGSDFQKRQLRIQSPQQSLNSLLSPTLPFLGRKNAPPRPCPRRNVDRIPGK